MNEIKTSTAEFIVNVCIITTQDAYVDTSTMEATDRRYAHEALPLRDELMAVND